MTVDIAALKSAQDKGLTVGVVPTSGEVPLRLEIDDFIQDTELANLYFLALEALQSDKVAASAFSYYEISGIHGQPHRAWDNVNSASFAPAKGSTDKDSGYCSHGSVIFPTWHRAYLAQFEQALFLQAAALAPGLNAQSVLDRFRIPYFDPFLPRQVNTDDTTFTYGMPIIFGLPQIKVKRSANADWENIDNPLYQFKFSQAAQNEIDFSYFIDGGVPNASKVTIRGLDVSTDSANHSYVIQALDNVYNPTNGLSTQAPLNLWQVMLGRNQSWVKMSNHYSPADREPDANGNPPSPNENSLEGFHDNIHVQLAVGSDGNGVAGTMSIPDYAGFDPSFWLHHCNVDRLLAIWQGIHSKDPENVQWWSSLEVPSGNFVEPALEKETPQTPLVPFRKSIDANQQPTWWTSSDVRDHRRMGYDYPQTAQALKSSDYAKSLVSWANAELGWLSPSGGSAPPDSSARAHLESSLKTSIPFFPSKILMDDKVALESGEAYVGSQSIAPREELTVQSVGIAAVAVKSTALEKADAVVRVTELGDPQKDIRQKVLQNALPKADLAFSDRFAKLGPLVSEDKTMTQWNLSFGVDKFALDGSFMLYFFLGDFSEDQSRWLLDPHLAGSSAIFASGRTRIDSGNCDNCEKQEQSGKKYTDTVALTPALITFFHNGEESHGFKVTSLAPEVIVPFLKENLQWRIIDARGAHVPVESVPSLKVMVYSENVHLPKLLTDKPVFEDEIVHFDITDGKPSGLRQGEQL